MFKSGGKYKFDWKFYLISVVIIFFVGVTFYLIKKTRDTARGKEVQNLLNKANLNSDESYRRLARNYIARLRHKYHLTKKETRKAEEIFERAFRERSHIWIQGNLEGRPSAEFRREQRESWENRQREFREFLKQIGKAP